MIALAFLIIASAFVFAIVTDTPMQRILLGALGLGLAGFSFEVGAAIERRTQRRGPAVAATVISAIAGLVLMGAVL